MKKRNRRFRNVDRQNERDVLNSRGALRIVNVRLGNIVQCKCGAKGHLFFAKSSNGQEQSIGCKLCCVNLSIRLQLPLLSELPYGFEETWKNPPSGPVPVRTLTIS